MSIKKKKNVSTEHSLKCTPLKMLHVTAYNSDMKNNGMNRDRRFTNGNRITYVTLIRF